MRVGIIGYKGFVGSALFQFFSSKGFDTNGIGRQNYDEMRNLEYDAIINANGNSKKRLAEQEPKKDFDANVKTTLDTILDFNYEKYIYISTIDVYNDTVSASNNYENAKIDMLSLSNYGFDKYLGELLVRKYAKKWLIFRLGGMVGPGLKKNMVFDIKNLKKTFVSPDSKYQYIDTSSVARIIHECIQQENEVYNVCGDGLISGTEIAKWVGVSLDSSLYSLKKEVYEVNISKISKILRIPRSEDSVKNHLARI